MDAWLRPNFLRKNTTPTISSTPSFSERPASFRSEKDVNIEDGRLRAGSRASSFMNLLTNSPVANTTPDIWPNISKADAVWDNPSPDQMADMLKVAMMTQSTMDPLPIHFNSCILHVVEAYWNLKERVKASDMKIEDLKEGHRRDIEEFETIAKAWEASEKNYKAEVKRLEVLLSKTRGGMATVAMARSNSVLHGSKRASQIIRDGIGTIKERNDVDRNNVTLEAVRNNRQLNDDRYKEPYQRKDKLDDPVLAALTPPAKFESQRMNKRILGIQPLGVESRREADSVLSYSQGDSAEMEAEPEVGLSSYSSSKDRLDKDQRRRSTRDRGDSFGSTSNSTSSGVPDYSSEDEDDDGLTMRKQDVVGLGIAAEGATFRKRPTIIIPSAEITESTSLERYLLRTSDTVPVDQPGQIGPRQMSFSFIPGANEILSRAIEEKWATAEDLLHSKNNNCPSSQSSTAHAVSSQSSSSYRKSAPPAPKGEMHSELSGTPTPQHARMCLQRDDSSHSNSSVITAVRRNSGHSSVGGSHNDSRQPSPSKNLDRIPRLQLDRGRGSSTSRDSSSDARTAATRAVAANARKQQRSEKSQLSSGYYGDINEEM